MTWIEAVPTGLACAAWLFLPGLALAYAVGLRGVALFAAAPIGSVAVLGTAAVAADLAGVPWSLRLAGAVCLIPAVLANLAAALLRHRRPAVVHRVDRWPVTVAALAGPVPGLVLGVVVLVRALRRPDALSQTFDAAFHYNALALIGQTHDASSLGLATLGSPGRPGSFYPAAFHDVASVALASADGGIPVTTNLLAATIALVAWPLACVLLARQLFGPSPASMIVTGVVSTGFAAYPFGLMAFGVLWPNLLGMIFVPVGLAAVLSIVGAAQEDVLGRPRAWLLLGATALGGAFAHPNALFSLVVLAVVPVLGAALRWARALSAAGRRWTGAAGVAAVLAAFGAVWAFAANSTALAAVRAIHWAPFESTPRAVGEVLLNGANGRPAGWCLSILVLLGAAAGWRAGPGRWLVVAHVLSGTLYVLTAAVNSVATQKYTGYWYNDSYRLAAMLPITGVPLAVLGVRYLAGLIADRAVPALAALPAAMNRLRPVATAGGVALLLTAVLLLATRGLGLPTRTEMLAGPYAAGHLDPGNTLVTADERTFFPRLKDKIGAHAVVANNPWDGSVLLWTLADRRVLVPHMNLVLSSDERYLTEHLVDAARDRRVCEIAARLRVEYMIIGDGRFWAWPTFAKEYVGITDPAGRPGFELLDAFGGNRLYRISACAAG